jgi:hypothetical protein
MPDKEVAARLGTRTHVAVMRMRRVLGLPKVPRHAWDGTPRPAPVAIDEVCRRYYSRLGQEPPDCPAVAAYPPSGDAPPTRD